MLQQCFALVGAFLTHKNPVNVSEGGAFLTVKLMTQPLKGGAFLTQKKIGANAFEGGAFLA